MPFDSNGVFSRVMNWTSDQQNGIAIECGRHDAEDNNFAEGFNETFCRDGRAAATGNFNLGNHKIQNLADGIAATDAVTKGQLDASSAAGVSLNTPQTITGQKTFDKPIVAKYGQGVRINGVDTYYTLRTTGSPQNGLSLLNENNSSFTYWTADTTNGFCSISPTGTTAIVSSSDAKYRQVVTLGWGNTHYVTLDTAQTITGDKTFTGNLVKQSNSLDYNGIRVQNTLLSKGTAPSTNIGGQFVFQDKDGYSINDRIGGLEVVYGSNGTIVTRMHACEPAANSSSYASISVAYPASGNPYTSAPTPTDTTTTSGTQIATTGWVNSTNNNAVHKSGNETIGGTKTFSNNVITEIPMNRGTGHANDIYGGYGIHDSNGNLFASLIAKSTAGSGEGNTTPGNSSVFLRVYNPNNTSSTDAKYLQLIYGADDSSYATCPASDKNGSIVTTINNSKKPKGYFELGNGLIIQWGKSQTSDSSGVFTLPKAFSSTNYAVVITNVMANVPASTGSNANVVGWGVVQTHNTGNFTAFLCNYENSYWWRDATKTVDWIAIGY